MLAAKNWEAPACGVVSIAIEAATRGILMGAAAGMAASLVEAFDLKIV